MCSDLEHPTEGLLALSVCPSQPECERINRSSGTTDGGRFCSVVLGGKNVVAGGPLRFLELPISVTRTRRSGTVLGNLELGAD